MGEEEPALWARYIVMDYFNSRKGADDATLILGDTRLIWFSSTICTWKALVTTTVPDGMYYEVFCDLEMEDVLLDAYRKIDSAEMTLSELRNIPGIPGQEEGS